MKRIAGLFILLLELACYSARGQATTNSESFDNLFRPPSWSGGAISGGYDWAQFTTGTHSGTGGAYYDSYDAAAGSNATLVSPSFSLGCQVGGLSVSFWMYRDNQYTASVDRLEVYINTTPNLAGATLLGTVNRPNTSAPAAAANTWNQYTFAVPAGITGATEYIVLNAVSQYGTYIFIDDVTWPSYPCASGGPANDYCSGATPVTCAGSPYAGNTTLATTTGDPTTYCGFTPGAPGVFYVLAGTGQNVTASVCGAAFDTEIQVYSGSCGALACVTGNDDYCGFQSQVTFPTSVGTNYYIMVDGFSGAKGAFSLALTCAAPAVANDDCVNATLETQGAACGTFAGNTTGATPDITGCSGTATSDVWYKFVATSTGAQITMTPSAGMDAVIELFSGNCAGLTSLHCQDLHGIGVAEVMNWTGLTVGVTYYVRAYDFAGGAGAFTMCIAQPPAPPANDDCAGAIAIAVNVACANTAGTTVNATSSAAGCSGTAAADVWYKFVAVNSSATVTVTPSATMDAVFQVYSGACGALVSMQCEDVLATGGTETYNFAGLTVGNTYYVRVYDYLGTQQTFNICVYGPAAAVIPSNDQPCNAIALPAVTTACNYLRFTNLHATQSVGPPVPSGCIGGSGGSAGFVGGGDDVWFSVVCPASGQLTITPEPYGQIAGEIEDGSMALYSGACGALTQVYCSSDNAGFPNGPGSVPFNQWLPFINQTGLTPGNTYYIRYWAFSTANDGPFGLCVQTTTNDACANALYVCDLNGYSASTSNAFTPDFPGAGATQMKGNDQVCCWATNGGANSGGVFGKKDAAGDINTSKAGLEEGVGRYDVTIDNNSWIRFTAASTKVVITVAVGECYKNAAYPSGGAQFQVFSESACTNFVPVSAFLEGTTTFVMTIDNLTVGSDYMLMVDGFAADVCNYTLTVNSGVVFPAIVPDSNPMCVGDNDNLTAPAGATSYYWPQTGETTQVITVQPASTTTYTCIVTGSCNERQTLTATITVSSDCAPLPVELLSLSAKYDGDIARVLWATASETNSSSFTVERSEDGINFNPIGSVPSKAPGGNSSVPLNYHLLDPSAKNGVFYYRLKQTDLNGDYKRSQIVSLDLTNDKASFGVHPNPTTHLSDITYYCYDSEVDYLNVYDHQGKLIMTREISSIKGKNSTPVDLSEQPSGIYFISLHANGKAYEVKLVKERE